MEQSHVAKKFHEQMSLEHKILQKINRFVVIMNLNHHIILTSFLLSVIKIYNEFTKNVFQPQQKWKS